MLKNEQKMLNGQVVGQAINDQVLQAVETAITDGTLKFDVKANFNTLLAVTGVILYWRGVWTLWWATFPASVSIVSF